MLLRNALRGFQNLSAKVLLFFDIYKKKGFCHYFANFICTCEIFLVPLQANIEKRCTLIGLK